MARSDSASDITLPRIASEPPPPERPRYFVQLELDTAGLILLERVGLGRHARVKRSEPPSSAASIGSSAGANEPDRDGVRLPGAPRLPMFDARHVPPPPALGPPAPRARPSHVPRSPSSLPPPVVMSVESARWESAPPSERISPSGAPSAAPAPAADGVVAERRQRSRTRLRKLGGAIPGWVVSALAAGGFGLAASSVMTSGSPREGGAEPLPLVATPLCMDVAATGERPLESRAPETTAPVSASEPIAVSVESLPLEGAAAEPRQSEPGEGVRSATSAPRRSAGDASGPSRKELARVLARAAANAAACSPDAEGSARVVVTFGPSGAVTAASFAGPVPASVRKACVLSALSRARIPAWSGAPVSAAKSIRF